MRNTVFFVRSKGQVGHLKKTHLMDHLPECLSRHHTRHLCHISSEKWQQPLLLAPLVTRVMWFLKLRLICMSLISVTVFSYGYSHTVFGSSDVCLESPQDHLLEMH